MTAFEERLTAVIPSPRQLEWQAMEFYAFVHYGINQFTNREWGTGKEESSMFNPAQLNTDQWCAVFKRAGMKGVIITAKHHDGFCLWDTKHTAHSVMYSPYGKDIVAQLASSCEKYGLKLGIYLSPWDRHEQCYGQGEAYNNFFCNQLTELLTNYGPIFCCWFDGACGEGANGKKQVYDWERYYNIIREKQPQAVISVCGPDVRWCGNEAGHCRDSEWSVVPASMADNEKVKEASQKEDSFAFRKKVPSHSEDLGSREALSDAEDLIWYPAEVNTSIRPGWFYHPEEDGQVRSLKELTDIYIQSVGGNASFLLNVPPHPQGFLAPPDVKRLDELGEWLKKLYAVNLLAGISPGINTHSKQHQYAFSKAGAAFSASSNDGKNKPEAINQAEGYWKANETDESPWVMAVTDKPITPRTLILQEEISRSQRIESFTLSCRLDGHWKLVYQGTIVGSKRICLLPTGLSAREWRLDITACRCGATLKTLGLYL